MRFPKFWLKPKNNLSILKYFLYPATLIWRFLLKVEQTFIIPQKSPIPVICIGNITVGGNGKTPTAMKVRSLLQELGFKPHILSRGYKSNFKGPHLVNPMADSFLDVGDEPLMMSSYGHTWIARDRRAGIKSAFLSGANIIILDDGFQNHSIVKDFSILVIETSVAFGNGCLIPAGPLREPISMALKKADLLITIGEKRHQNHFEKEFSYLKLPSIFHSKLKPKKDTLNLNKKKVLAFTGIGHPSKFQSTLENLGAKILRLEVFSNHKPFKLVALKRLITEAKIKKAILITTEKDFVKVPKTLQGYCHILKVELDINNQKLFVKKLTAFL
jgi:tetraacyldisaccharide 4'-kinase